MTRYKTAIENAKKEIRFADHMLNVTFSLVNDPKMLLSVISRLNTALKESVAAVLYYEREFKRVPIFPADFKSMFNLFKSRCTRRYNINIEYITLIQEVTDIMNLHKTSPVEFTRQGKLILCTDGYRMKSINKEDLKNYINKAKLFIRESENMVSRNG